MNRFADKVAIVTGAGQGIGAATALRLARAGARVAAIRLREGSGDSTVAAITGAGGAAIALTCDVGDATAVDAMVARVVAEWGPRRCGRQQRGDHQECAADLDVPR